MISFFRKGIVLICVFIFSQCACDAQTYLHDPITKLKNNDAYALYPFAGGLNNPQFDAVDLNADGIKDLVVFDRNGGKVLTFKNNGTPGLIDYSYAPEYEAIFPPMKNWFVLADLNCDGVEDIFTSLDTTGDNAKMRYYEAVLDVTGLHYKLGQYKMKFHEAGFTFDFGVGIIDIPGFVDVNFDGDLDVLTFNLAGGVVDYYENMRVENGLDCDSIYFEHVNGCWGNFYETGLKKSVDLDQECKGVTSGSRDGVHAGSTFMCFDEENDGDIDIVLGDLAFGNLNRLLNGGDNTFADIVAQDTTYPEYNVPYELDIFPSPFLVDINNDGKQDMLVAPNKESISENFKNVWYYRNIATDATYNFEFQNDSLFVSDMVDAGEGARAAFFDYNADGLMDIVIGNRGYYDGGVFISKLALYENTGTASLPEFTLITRDYANISGVDIHNLAPAFGDLDGDGDQDMLIGDSEGDLRYFNNSGGPGEPAIFTGLTVAVYGGIDVGINATPQIIDVNEDGILDLIVGEQNGNLNYYKGEGDDSFTLVSDFWGSVDVRVTGSLTGHSTPFLIKQDGNWKLYIGCEDGTILLYEPTADFTGTFTKITSKFSDIDEGSYSSVQFMDITADDTLEMLTANQRGGISLYRDAETIDHTEDIFSQEKIGIYPVPAHDVLHFTYPDNRSADRIRIYNVTGSLMLEQELRDNTADISALVPGVYIIRFFDDRYFSVTAKFMKW